ncbi:Putative protein of unknown function [Podospora comata]|uniref:Uncharacterized protein n=1 Tax=Podospora comata TaxID=48703 RepID=A0ABY6S942_PODCO|nr:Putative protein of unknown function [Podospora comata]
MISLDWGSRKQETGNSQVGHSQLQHCAKSAVEICIHYNGPGKDIELTEFDNWNYEGDDKLADLKKGHVSDEGDFINRAKKKFTPYYQLLVPWVNRLRRKVFPSGERWKKPQPNLYFEMRKILSEARKDPNVVADLNVGEYVAPPSRK